MGCDLQRDLAGLGLAGDELLPRLSALTDDVSGVPGVLLARGPLASGNFSGCALLVLALAGESELVLRLSVWDLVDAEPLIRSPQEAREVALDVLDVVELRCQRVVDIDDDDLPVSLLLVKERHDAEDLDLLDLAGVADELTDLAHVERVVITLGLGLGVDDVGVFPGLVGV